MRGQFPTGARESALFNFTLVQRSACVYVDRRRNNCAAFRTQQCYPMQQALHKFVPVHAKMRLKHNHQPYHVPQRSVDISQRSAPPGTLAFASSNSLCNQVCGHNSWLHNPTVPVPGGCFPAAIDHGEEQRRHIFLVRQTSRPERS